MGGWDLGFGLSVQVGASWAVAEFWRTNWKVWMLRDVKISALYASAEGVVSVKYPVTCESGRGFVKLTHLDES